MIKTDEGKIMTQEVQGASKEKGRGAVKSGKVVGSDHIPVEVWRCLGESSRLFNQIAEHYPGA